MEEPIVEHEEHHRAAPGPRGLRGGLVIDRETLDVETLQHSDASRREQADDDALDPVGPQQGLHVPVQRQGSECREQIAQQHGPEGVIAWSPIEVPVRHGPLRLWTGIDARQNTLPAATKPSALMTSRAWIIALLLACSSPTRATDWQVVLLKPRDCNACTYVEQILKQGSQLREAQLKDLAGGQVAAPIERRTSAELSAQEWSELRLLPHFDEAGWRRQAAARAAQVLLKRDGVVVAAGDIAESADLRQARYPAALTMPDPGRDPMAIRNALAAYTGDLFLRSWNLDWLYRMSLDPAARPVSANRDWITRQADAQALPLGAANVMLMSTASGAADNEIFNALRIEEIRDVLSQSIGLPAGQLHVFYGGDNAVGANALEVRDGRIGLVRRNVANASPFSPEAAIRIFQSIRTRPRSRNLLVLIGHGSPDGAGMWAVRCRSRPLHLRALHEHGGGDDILVSGNCFGGVMARATRCGFFGARPDLIATGCQADAAEVAQSRDYLHMFFSSLTPAGKLAADADRNGDISFAEAHWHASTLGDARNVTYTSVDALADDWFEAHPDKLPRSRTVREILALASTASPAEASALRNLLAGFGAEVSLPLGDLAGQAALWTPDSGKPRIVVAQLARRLLYLQDSSTPRPEAARLQSCEDRSVAAFLAP